MISARMLADRLQHLEPDARVLVQFGTGREQTVEPTEVIRDRVTGQLILRIPIDRAVLTPEHGGAGDWRIDAGFLLGVRAALSQVEAGLVQINTTPNNPPSPLDPSTLRLLSISLSTMLRTVAGQLQPQEV